MSLADWKPGPPRPRSGLAWWWLTVGCLAIWAFWLYLVYLVVFVTGLAGSTGGPLWVSAAFALPLWPTWYLVKPTSGRWVAMGACGALVVVLGIAVAHMAPPGFDRLTAMAHNLPVPDAAEQTSTSRWGSSLCIPGCPVLSVSYRVDDEQAAYEHVATALRDSGWHPTDEGSDTGFELGLGQMWCRGSFSVFVDEPRPSSGSLSIAASGRC
jgi:hypothetical protein